MFAEKREPNKNINVVSSDIIEVETEIRGVVAHISFSVWTNSTRNSDITVTLFSSNKDKIDVDNKENLIIGISQRDINDGDVIFEEYELIDKTTQNDRYSRQYICSVTYSNIDITSFFNFNKIRLVTYNGYVDIKLSKSVMNRLKNTYSVADAMATEIYNYKINKTYKF